VGIVVQCIRIAYPLWIIAAQFVMFGKIGNLSKELGYGHFAGVDNRETADNHNKGRNYGILP